VEDIEELLVSIQMVEQPKGTFVDINVHKSRRAVHFGGSQKKSKGRVRPTRREDAGLSLPGDIHPGVLECGATVIKCMLEDPHLKVEADGRDLWMKEPELVEMDPSEFQAGLIDIPKGHSNDLWDFVDPDLEQDKANQARAKKRLDAIKARKKRAAAIADGSSSLEPEPAPKSAKSRKKKR
jgi:hypothetical protein